MKDFILTFNPVTHKFYAEWFLDLYGFLSREDLKNRISDINNLISKYPLMSSRMVKILSALIIILGLLGAGLGAGFSFGFVNPNVGIAIAVTLIVAIVVSL